MGHRRNSILSALTLSFSLAGACAHDPVPLPLPPHADCMVDTYVEKTRKKNEEVKVVNDKSQVAQTPPPTVPEAHYKRHRADDCVADMKQPLTTLTNSTPVPETRMQPEENAKPIKAAGPVMSPAHREYRRNPECMATMERLE